MAQVESRSTPGASTGRRSMMLEENWRIWAVSIGTFLLIVTVWEAATRLQLTSPLILPPLESVVSQMYAGLVSERLWWQHVGVTLAETVIGFGLGVLAALVLGGTLAFLDTVRRGLHPYILGVQTFPKVAIAPLLMTWLGYGLSPKVALAAFLSFFPVYSATVAGLTAIDPDQLSLMRVLGSRKWQELKYFRFPHAATYILPSLDVALVMAFLGALVGELVSARSGLGYLIALNTTYGDMGTVYGVLILLAMLGMALHLLMSLSTRSIRFMRR